MPDYNDPSWARTAATTPVPFLSWFHAAHYKLRIVYFKVLYFFACEHQTACSSQVTRILLIIRKCWMKIFSFFFWVQFKTSCSFSERHVRSVECAWPLQWLSCAGALPCVNKNAQILSLFIISHNLFGARVRPSLHWSGIPLASVLGWVRVEGERFGDHADDNFQGSYCDASSASHCLHHGSGGAGCGGRSWAW